MNINIIMYARKKLIKIESDQRIKITICSSIIVYHMAREAMAST